MQEVVTALISDKQSHLLVSQRSFDSKVAPGKWQTPGGKVEIGETHQEALIREVYEETGMEVKSISNLLFKFADWENDFFVYLYQVEAVGKPQSKESGKLQSDWIYLSIDEIWKKDIVASLSEFIKKEKKK